MKTGFKNPIEEKNSKKKDFSKIWNFDAPAYDERSSCYMRAGTDHGVGYRQPVGHSGNPKPTSPMLPEGRVKTMEVDEVV